MKRASSPECGRWRFVLQSVEDDTRLFTTHLLDSFQLVDFIVKLEQRAGFRMRPQDVTLEHLDSVARIVSYVNQVQAREFSEP